MDEVSISVPSPPTTINSTLSQFLISGHLADVEFIVGPDRVQVKAHGIILKMRSDVFTPMLSSKWKTDLVDLSADPSKGEETVRIEIPNLDPHLFKAFLHYLYTDEIYVSDGENSADVELLLDLLVMSDMYDVVPLFDKTSAILSSSLSLENCVNIYESTMVNEQLGRNAMQFIKSNISQLLHLQAYLSSGREGHWAYETWLEILTSDEMVVEEVELFLAIVKWTEGDEGQGRFGSMKTHLLQLIRYPVMTSEEFAQHVVPTGLLQNDDVIKILLFYIDYKGTHTPSSLLPYKLQSRSIKRPTTSADLSYFLKNSTPGDIIYLLDQEYDGSFNLTTSYVTLIGEGPNSALTTCDPDSVILTLDGNRCTIFCLRLHHKSSDPKRTARLTKPLLQVNGNYNSLENLEVNTGSYWTEISLPDGSVPSNKLLKQNPSFAIGLVGGSGNGVMNLTCINRGNAICLEGGKGNFVQGIVSKICYDGQSRTDFGTAVLVSGGSGHYVEGVAGDWYLKLGEESRSISVSFCDLLGVTVDGIGHNFVGVKARRWVKVRGQDHSFDIDCVAGRWDWNRQERQVEV